MVQRCELVFIIDRSGSMAGLEQDTIGGFNAMLEKQKRLLGEATVTTVLFDNQYELLHDRVNIKDIVPLTSKEYYVRGTTALLDAIGMTISRIAEGQLLSSPEERADKVIFVITTDGAENASYEFTFKQVNRMVQAAQDDGWEFLFLGANIDAIATAAAYGIRNDRAANYAPDSEGTALQYQVVHETISDMRANRAIDESWKQPIEEYWASTRHD